MVWMIALVCLGLAGVAGKIAGPVRAAFSFVGLVLAMLLVGPLSPLTRHLLPLLGLKHPVWAIFVPQLIAFAVVLIIFKIAGHALHEKISFQFKYKVDDRKRIDWERLYSRLGLCVGLLNGAVYFVLLMIPIYAAGYFTTEAAADNAPLGAKILTNTRAQMTHDGMDRVAVAYDPTPPRVYQAADIATLVLHNPLLESRLAHYPPLMELGERPAFQALGTDPNLQQLVAEGKILEVIKYPPVQAMLTNGDIVTLVSGMIGNDLDDLQHYLTTGQSDKFDGETILGVWDIDSPASLAQERRRHPGLTPLQVKQIQSDMFPVIAGLSLTALPNKQIILKKQDPATMTKTKVATGTWKKEEGAYQINLPGNRPETSVIEIQEGNKLLLPKDSYVLVFDKEIP
jgi:hypothetical protein